MALVDIAGLSGDGCTGLAGEDLVGAQLHTQLNIISSTLVLQVKMRDTSDTHTYPETEKTV